METTTKVFKSIDVGEDLWSSYINNFNLIFEKEYSFDLFKQKYFYTIYEYSYHSFLVNKDNNVVGACTIIPYEYLIGEEKKLLGLVVDVFILEKFRTSPFLLSNLYKSLKSFLIEDDIKFIIAVPNKDAYPYWKKVVKWKDIGRLPYYVLPVKTGNILGKYQYANSLNAFFVYLYISIVKLFLIVFDSSNKESYIHINRNNTILEKHRYSKNHKLFKNTEKNIFFSYTVVNEKGVNTVYILDFYNNKRIKTSSVLNNTVMYILKKEKVDLIIFVGKLNFFQTTLFKLRKNREPKALTLTGDVIIDVEDSDIWFDYKNWDFGLFNYDVR